MKKRNEWVRKALKREEKGKDRGTVDLIRIMFHFFKELPQWINSMKDPRHVSYITYSQADLVFLGLLKNTCSVLTMRDMEEKFNEETCIQTLRLLSGDHTLTEMPHYDTLNYYLERLSPACLADIRRQMVKQLIRNKSFYRGRLLGRYWRVILDGTGLFYFKEKHCENCLVTTIETEDGKKAKRYYHKVLEAKLVLSEKIVISLDTEFIENEKETVGKNDCEINAAKRLMKRLKKEYPRLELCIQEDALYAAEPIMELCKENRWGYIFTNKETRQPSLAESFAWICEGGGGMEAEGIGEKKESGCSVDHVERTAGKKQPANIYEYRYTQKDKNGEEKQHRFQWVTDIELTEKNLEEMIQAGRGRWKIENRFNDQKNGMYDIEHLNSRNSTAMKNHYLLTQLADIVMQLYLSWSPLVKKIKESKRNTSSRLLESFRRQTVTDEDVLYIQRYTTVYLE